MRKKVSRQKPKWYDKYWLEPEYKKLVIAWCRCYKSWKYRLMDLRNALRAIEYKEDVIQTSGDYNQTEDIALKCVELEKKLDILESTAKEVAPDLYFWLIKGVTDEYVTVSELIQQGMPCSRNTYSRLTDKFYYVLSKRIDV